MTAVSTTGLYSDFPKDAARSQESDTARVVGPRDCVIAFGIPTCQAGFKGRRSIGTSDYIVRFSGWSQYNMCFVRFLSKLEPGLRDVGVTVKRDVTPLDFAKLFERYQVVILFSHWKDEDPDFPLGAVELEEGLVDIDTIVDAVPQEYDGFLDLCVCHPKNLIKALAHARPRCHIKHLNIKAKPDFWLYFYGKLFYHLHVHPMRYTDALILTRAELVGETHDGSTA